MRKRDWAVNMHPPAAAAHRGNKGGRTKSSCGVVQLRIRLVQITAWVILIGAAAAQTTPLPDPPQLRAKHHVLSLTLHAVNERGRDAFAFNGATVPPVLRVSPGDKLRIEYVNDLPATSPETCAIDPCMDMTNLHFHGLAVSPNAPQDDVLDMLARPGETLHYSVEIPRDHQPGLFWYHTHPHGESHRQALDGMSGAIVIEGMERYVPEVKGLPERVLVVRGLSIKHDAGAAALRQRVDIPAKRCGGEREAAEEIMTVNGAIRPSLAMAPGERQFWRIVNASADRYLDLQLDGEQLEIVALDGMPLAYHDREHPTLEADHFLVAPAGRLEAIVTGPPQGAHAALRTLCVDPGPLGDPNPAMVLADVVTSSAAEKTAAKKEHVTDKRPPMYAQVDVEKFKTATPEFTVIFTEDKNGFYINGAKFAADAPPMTTVNVGTYQHWRIVNATAELHPFHIHQVHFLAYAENATALTHPQWLDTVNVPVGSSVDVILDLTNPVIKGMAVFHCHLLNHEDKGMMAKVLFK
ncbi:MAG TPA: multicopper oxidase family protein [Candidatus Binatia bacterium]|nr:multicopper oxidase family protein [Candidatus Binatia bacterium]